VLERAQVFLAVLYLRYGNTPRLKLHDSVVE